MAHEAQNDFFQIVKQYLPEYFRWSNVLEIGSLNINGTIRDLFSYCNYLGVDIGPGNGVDLVESGHKLQFRDNSFDASFSAECFEHNPFWAETFTNMVRMTKSYGLVAFTCAGEGRAEHGTARSDVGSSPLTVAAGWDYYRNLSAYDFYPYINGFVRSHFIENHVNQDLYFVGIKQPEVNWFGDLTFDKLREALNERFPA